jgi:dipeptidase E
MKLLLISNSTNPGEQYLDYPKENIRDFLGQKPSRALFIPYAAVTFSYDVYEEKVRERFREIGHDIISIHRFSDPVAAVMESSAIIVGGGNSFKLLKMIRDNDLINVVRQRVIKGTPYIGWSAGSNMACPTIKTTNDMPIVEPDSFSAFNLVPFQINPHYLDANPQGHAGETREQRIEEFLEANPGVYVAGLREGSMLIREGKLLRLTGQRKLRIFKYGLTPFEADSSEDISFLLTE